jgi:hypothetical protein
MVADGQVFDMLPALLQPHHQLLLLQLQFPASHVCFLLKSGKPDAVGVTHPFLAAAGALPVLCCTVSLSCTIVIFKPASRPKCAIARTKR